MGDSRQTGPLAQGSDLDGHIPLGPQATIRATLTSNEALTLFSVAGVGARSELLLPPTSIAKVLLPSREITITGSQPCFKDLVHFVQVGSGSGKIEIQFFFVNLDRRPECDGRPPATSILGHPKIVLPCLRPWPGLSPITATMRAGLGWPVC